MTALMTHSVETGTMPNPPTSSDASLVVAVAKRDESALAMLYERHAGPVFGLARRLLRRQDLAEEVSQEVFTRLWMRPERFDPERGSLRTFLLSDTHGRSIDLLRSELARSTREEREGRIAPTAPSDIETEAITLVTNEHVRAALAELPDAERTPIALAYFDGYSYRQVAELLGQPQGTVKSRIRSGMQHLKTALGRSGVLAP